MSAPMFKFDFHAAQKDGSGYCHVRWDQAQPITVFGVTEEEAINKAAKVLVQPRAGYCWTFRTLNIEEMLNPKCDQEDTND